MKITLPNKNYYIVDDTNGSVNLIYDIGKTSKNSKTGVVTPSVEIKGYYATVEQAVKKYIRLETERKSKDVTVLGYIENMKEVVKTLEMFEQFKDFLK